MLIMMYWELSEDMPADERLGIAGELMESGMFPPEGAKVLGWWGTPDNWGILLIEAENEAAAFNSLNSWRMAGPGIFSFTKSAPAMKIEDSIQLGIDMMEKMGGE